MISLTNLVLCRWVMMIEKKICDCDNKLVMYHESMKRMKKR